LISQLERVAMALRQQAEKGIEPIAVHLPCRWELKQDRPESAAEHVYSWKEFFQRRFRIAELLIVRDEAAGFNGENEVGWRRSAPRVKFFLRRELIKAIFDLDRVEVLNVRGEHPGCRQRGAVKRAPPMFVVPPGSADADFTGHAYAPA